MDEAFTTSTNSGPGVNLVRGILGAAVGGAAGFFLSGWLLRHGLFAAAAPGALLGLGCGIFVQRSNVLLALLCGLSALALSLFTEWHYMPFIADGSLPYFIQHLSPVKWILHGIGALLGFWFSLGTRGKQQPAN